MRLFKWIMSYFWRRIHRPREAWQIVDDQRNKSRAENLLLLRRKAFTKISTIGDLYYGGIYQCKILEDSWRDPDGSGQLDADEKIYGKTAIPVGVYRVVFDYSTRFKTIMPHVLNVPHFGGIRFHAGNRAVNTLGCLLTGTTHAKDVVVNSKNAYIEFVKKLIIDCQEKKVWLEVVNAEGEEFQK